MSDCILLVLMFFMVFPACYLIVSGMSDEVKRRRRDDD